MDVEEIREGLEKYSREACIWYYKNKTEIDAAFPSGWIRSIDSLKSRWPYLSQNDARTVACAIQLCDVNMFFMQIYTVRLTAGAMWEWHVTLPVIAVIETLCSRVVRKEGWGQGNKFSNCINKLSENGIIDPPLKQRIEEQKDYRDEVHLYLKDKIEVHDGVPQRYNKAVDVLQDLEEALSKHYS